MSTVTVHRWRRLFCGILLFAVLVTASPVAAQQAEVDALATRIAQRIAKSGKTKVIVLDFVGPGPEITELGRWLAEAFSAALPSAGRHLTVLDRASLQAVAGRKSLAKKDTPDPMSSVWVGQLAGAELVVTGRIEFTPDDLKLRLGLWKVAGETQEVAQEVERLPRTKEIGDLLFNTARSFGPGVSTVALERRYADRIADSDSLGTLSAKCGPPNSCFAVLLELTVTDQGRASDIRLIRGVGFGVDELVLTAVRRWQFKAAKMPDGRAVPVRVKVEIIVRPLGG